MQTFFSTKQVHTNNVTIKIMQQTQKIHLKVFFNSLFNVTQHITVLNQTKHKLNKITNNSYCLLEFYTEHVRNQHLP